MVPSLSFFARPLQSWAFSCLRRHLHSRPLLAPTVPSLSCPSCLQNQYHLGDFYTTKFGCQDKIQPWQPLEHSLCVLIPRKHFPEDSTSLMMLSSQSPLTSQLQLTNIDYYRNAKASLSGASLLLTTTASSVPANLNCSILIQNNK